MTQTKGRESRIKASPLTAEVVDIRKLTGDKIKALADIRLQGCITIKGVYVLSCKSGMIVQLPRKVSKEGRWFDVLDVDDALKHEIEDKVLEAYDREVDGVSGA